MRDLREAMHSHVLRSTIAPDPELQKPKQAAAAKKLEAEQEPEREIVLRTLQEEITLRSENSS